VQAATHPDPVQTSPAGQSALVTQPHAPMGAPAHTLPPVDVAQSAAAAHPHVCADVSQVRPRGLAAQSAFVAHPTQKPVVVSHAGPAGLPVQSALLAQALLHWPFRLGPGLEPHTWPLAQSVIALQPQTGKGTCMPPSPPAG